METTKVVVGKKASSKYYADLVVYCIEQRLKDKPDIGTIDNIHLQKAIKLHDFKGEQKDILLVYNDNEKSNLKSKRIAFVGIGHVSKKDTKAKVEEKLRIAGGNIAQLSRKLKASKICIYPPERSLKNNDIAVINGLTEGLFLGDYAFNKYQSTKNKKDTFSGIKEIRYILSDHVQIARKTAARAQVAAIAACHARDMANEPGNGWTPQSFADYGKRLSTQFKLKCRVFDKKRLENLGMGGILAVNKGSAISPKLVIIEHQVSTKAKTLLLVGKGLTFDSGGISLKPAAGMEDMKYDMCGGAAVISAMNAVGKEQPNCNVIALIPTTDNMSGGDALKPGDIVTHYNKVSSEIINTDAEGRLILADALAYGIEKYAPDYVIDLATLTGAVIIGLGHHHTGLMSNNNALAKKLLDAGKRCSEPLWRLPLGEHYKKQIESKVADIKNTGGRAGGAITAAEYLHHFVGDTPWAHLDIAGTAWGYTEKPYIPQNGPSGIGVRTLLEFIREIG